MTSPAELGCTRQRADDAARYLSGRMPATEAEEFERHYFECDDCAREMEIAAVVRAVKHPAAKKQWGRFGAGFAVAAMVVLAILTIVPGEDSDPRSYRGAQETRIDALAKIEGGSVTLSWREVPGASVYRVSLISSDGNVLEQRETVKSPMTLAVAGRNPDDLYGRVEAVDATRHRVAISGALRPR